MQNFGFFILYDFIFNGLTKKKNKLTVSNEQEWSNIDWVNSAQLTC